ncbi:26533_t:CDS:2 [Dentiscutata erythropus]|uniref:26533_t:CDS:1 n=1 Tax=Dentiscutata erythropus TaxID=1348616 RepID=A0A9N8WBT8_9GLOM|nr:26533_t:CDS:2 [Dentiscutata erythropus]
MQTDFPYTANEFPGRAIEPLSPVVVDKKYEYEVNEILDTKLIWKKLYYLVDWKGYDINECSWELAKNVGHTKEVVKAFHHRYPDKPGPVSVV